VIRPFCLMPLLALLWLGIPDTILAAGDGFRVHPISALPFVLLLGSIAALPLLLEHWWHSNRNKGIVCVLLGVPVTIYLLSLGEEGRVALWHGIEEYLAFIALLLALYTIAGGILIAGDLLASVRTNTLILAIGAVLANLIGTTGASMVLIRPLLRANRDRKHSGHLPVFFILIVSNTGGLLTPLGDPPLFLGFLKGVDFFWTLSLWKEWLIVNVCLLSIFAVWDHLALKKETAESIKKDVQHRVKLSIHGLAVNGPLLVIVLLAVVLQSPSVGQSLGQSLGIGDITIQHPIPEIIMVALTTISLLLTKKRIRQGNLFEWGPIVEVAVLFIGIFVTMVPALALLREHSSEIPLKQPWQFFWITGSLSSFLDNAPTYVTFATIAANGDQFGPLMKDRPDILAAISCGAVFMGAMTYIGNGPNFMVKAIAEKMHYKMPSFVGYMTKFTLPIMLPVMLVITLIFFIG